MTGSCEVKGALVFAVEHFECDNCGESWWIIAISAASVIVALLAAWFAWRSDKNSSEMLGMMRTEHLAFLEAAGKEIKLEVVVHWENEGVETDVSGATYTYKQITIGVANTGDILATDATLNLLFPEDLAYMSRIVDVTAEVRNTTEQLPTSTEPVDSMYYALTGLTFPRNIATIITLRVRLGNTTRDVPIKAKVIDANGKSWIGEECLRAKGIT